MIIADSGGTKTAWLIATDGRSPIVIHTAGINPAVQSPETIAGTIAGELAGHELASEVDFARETVYFYGAGCLPAFHDDLRKAWRDALGERVPKAIHIEEDLVGAARALCGHHPGLVCIIGTGSNSGLYDGRDIVCSTPAMGYILGDEGSGAYLGRRLLNGLYKGIYPEDLLSLFERETGLTMESILTGVYRRPGANRFLAGLTRFIHAHLDREEMRTLVEEGFEAFARINLGPYQRRDLPVHAIGGVASAFREQFVTALTRQGFVAGEVVEAPLAGLAAYHGVEMPL